MRPIPHPEESYRVLSICDLETTTLRRLWLTGAVEPCVYGNINLLTPNVNYSGRTASLTSKVAFYILIQQI